jgi:hypothetical protein
MRHGRVVIEAAAQQVFVTLVQVLRELLDNLCLARGIDPQRGEARSELPRPVRHDSLP